MKVRYIEPAFPEHEVNSLFTIGKVYEVVSVDKCGDYYCISDNGKRNCLLKREVEVIHPASENEMVPNKDESYEQLKDEHYNNENGSLYLFAQQHGLNAYEFDCIKRIVRCRKKGQFKEDLEKTKRVIDLYLKENEL